MIKSITKAYVRHYRDNGQVKAYIEGVGNSGKPFRTEGPVHHVERIGREGWAWEDVTGTHMAALLRRAQRDGLTVENEIW